MNNNRTIDLHKHFNCSQLKIKEMEAPEERIRDHIPVIDPNYVFELNFLNHILMYLGCPLHDCLYLSGPSGCGKTSAVLQVAARLGWGVEQLTLSSRSESADLIGHATLRRGELVYEYGPLVTAMIYGEILLLNEIDLMAPGDLAALNDVLEGKPLTIVANNAELIRPHRMFRIVATANTKGSGDSLGYYSGARLLNQAFLDRWRFVELNYPSTRVETSILKKNAPSLAPALIGSLVRFAAEIRRVGAPDEEGKVQLGAPFSTRTLIRIGRLLESFPDLSPLEAVDLGFGSRLNKVEREYVRRLGEDVFGHDKTEESAAENGQIIAAAMQLAS